MAITIHEALETYLKNNITAVGGRVFLELAPAQTALPYIAYTRVGAEYAHQFGKDSGFNDSLFQVDIYASTAKDVQTVATDVRKKMIDFSGTMATLNVQSVVLDNQADGLDEDTKYFRVMQEYTITFNEEV